MDGDAVVYNIVSMWEVAGAIDKDRLENTFKELIRQHESLRTSFHLVNEEPVQGILDTVDSRQWTVDSRGEPPCSPGDSFHHFVRPFDLSLAPLLRVGLIEVEKEKHILMVDMHHIISDGVSAVNLVQDFTALYGGEELPGARLRYRDYAGWQNHERRSARFPRQEKYWKKEFAGEIPVLDLPTDYSRPSVQCFEGRFLGFEIDREHLDG